MSHNSPCAALLLIMAAVSDVCSAADLALIPENLVAIAPPVPPAAGIAAPQNSSLRRLITTAGHHFAVSSGKPASPAPTLFIIANSIDAMSSDPTQFYTVTGRDLAHHGWIAVVLDPPVGVAEGHRAMDDAYQRESEFLRKQIPKR